MATCCISLLHKKSRFPILFTTSYFAFTPIIEIFLIFIHCNYCKTALLLFPIQLHFFCFSIFCLSLTLTELKFWLGNFLSFIPSLCVCAELRFKSQTVEGSWIVSDLLKVWIFKLILSFPLFSVYLHRVVQGIFLSPFLQFVFLICAILNPDSSVRLLIPSCILSLSHTIFG